MTTTMTTLARKSVLLSRTLLSLVPPRVHGVHSVPGVHHWSGRGQRSSSKAHIMAKYQEWLDANTRNLVFDHKQLRRFYWRFVSVPNLLFAVFSGRFATGAASTPASAASPRAWASCGCTGGTRTTSTASRPRRRPSRRWTGPSRSWSSIRKKEYVDG